MGTHSLRATLSRTATLVACGSMLYSGAALADEAVLVLLDKTGSMTLNSVPGKTRLQVAKERINAFLDAVPADPATRYAFWTFSDSTYTPVYTFAQNKTRAEIKAAVTAVSATGSTPLAHSVCAAVDELITTNALTLRIYMATDGEENSTPVGSQCYGPSSTTAYPSLAAGSWQRKVLNKTCTGDANIPGPCATGPSPISLVVDVDHLFDYVPVTSLKSDDPALASDVGDGSSGFATLNSSLDAAFFKGLAKETKGGYTELTPQTPPNQATPLPGDANRDGCVNVTDRQVVLSLYGQTVPSGSGPDFNRNGLVDSSDHQTVLNNYGRCVTK